MVDIDPSEAETISILTRNGIIGEAVIERKVTAPEVTKITAPIEIKKRGRPAKNASDTAD